jgi:putative transposase
MPRKRFTPEQIISKLREAEVLLSQGKTTVEVCRTLNVSEQTYYRWPPAAKSTGEWERNKPTG